MESNRKKAHTAQIDFLTAKICEMESVLKQSLARSLADYLVATMDTLNDILLNKARACIARCKRAFYEFGNKLSRMLARALSSTRLRNYITQNRGENGSVHKGSASMAIEF